MQSLFNHCFQFSLSTSAKYIYCFQTITLQKCKWQFSIIHLQLNPSFKSIKKKVKRLQWPEILILFYMYVRAFPEYGRCKDLIPYEQHPGVKKGTPVLLRTYPNLIYWELFISRKEKRDAKLVQHLKKKTVREKSTFGFRAQRGWGEWMMEEWQQKWLLSLNYQRDQGELPWNKEEMLHTHYFIFISLFLSNICPPTMWHCLLFIAISTDFSRAEVGNLQKCFNDSETKGLSQKSWGFCCWGCTMFQTWPGFIAPVLTPKHISLFVVRHML